MIQESSDIQRLTCLHKVFIVQFVGQTAVVSPFDFQTSYYPRANANVQANEGSHAADTTSCAYR